MSLKILVPVKRVIDPYVKIHVKPNFEGIEAAHVKHVMNPFDEIAMEEALRIFEKQLASEIVAVSIGTELSLDILRHALALGAHRAILIKTDENHTPLHIAKILRAVVQKESPNLVLMGKQAIDGDNNQTPQMLAALLDWPQATFASTIRVADDTLEVTREVDAGLETIQVTLPAVVSTDLRLNEPRYATLPNIMKAKQKPLEILELSELSLDLQSHTKIVSVKPPEMRQRGVKVPSVEALIDKLRHEAKVL